MFISRLLVIFSAVAVGISTPTQRTVSDIKVIKADVSTLTSSITGLHNACDAFTTGKTPTQASVYTLPIFLVHKQN
jgi:ribonuclease PH